VLGDGLAGVHAADLELGAGLVAVSLVASITPGWGVAGVAGWGVAARLRVAGVAARLRVAGVAARLRVAAGRGGRGAVVTVVTGSGVGAWARGSVGVGHPRAEDISGSWGRAAGGA